MEFTIGDNVSFKHKGKQITGSVVGISSRNGELRIEKIIDKKRLIITGVDPDFVQMISENAVDNDKFCSIIKAVSE